METVLDYLEIDTDEITNDETVNKLLQAQHVNGDIEKTLGSIDRFLVEEIIGELA